MCLEPKTLTPNLLARRHPSACVSGRSEHLRNSCEMGSGTVTNESTSSPSSITAAASRRCKTNLFPHPPSPTLSSSLTVSRTSSETCWHMSGFESLICCSGLDVHVSSGGREFSPSHSHLPPGLAGWSLIYPFTSLIYPRCFSLLGSCVFSCDCVRLTKQFTHCHSLQFDVTPFVHALVATFPIHHSPHHPPPSSPMPYHTSPIR